MSHQLRIGFDEFRALAAIEGDVGDEGLVFEAVPRLNEAAAAVHIVDTVLVFSHRRNFVNPRGPY